MSEDAADVQGLQREIAKCEFEPGSKNEDGETEWAVEVPDDATVRVEMAVFAGGHRELVGGANITGRYEMTLQRVGDVDD